MGKQKIIEAAKRKGLSVESADWEWNTSGGENYPEWRVVFGEEMDELYGKDQFQLFAHTAEALEWIDSLEPLPPREDD